MREQLDDSVFVDFDNPLKLLKNHPCSFMATCNLLCFSILVYYFFQISFRLKVIFIVAKNALITWLL